MASAMARGWARTSSPPAMLFCDLDPERAETLARDTGGETRADLRSLRDDCDVLLLAVKPAALESVAAELAGVAPALLSVVAATTLADLDRVFPGVPALRVMPNQPVEVGRGVLCFARPADFPSDLGASLVALLNVLGTPFELPEDRIDAAMAVMSCAPAYAATFAEALADAGARDGLEPALALELVAGTLEGTAELLRERDPESIRQSVAPPGGATEAGLKALADNGFAAAIAAAVEASLERYR